MDPFSEIVNTTAKNNVASVLRSSKISKIPTFTFEGHTFRPGHLSHMYHELTNSNGKLNVEVDTNQSSSAYYKSATNTLYLKFVGVNTLTRRALVVHETTHALFDFKAANMDIATSESIAYIAQCCYARANSTDPDPEVRLTGAGNKDVVFEVGWRIAGKLLGGGSIDSTDVRDMRDAVAIHPFYSADHSTAADFDGM
ncbi:MAG: hypothetical protein DWQ47_13210 [Acidobacteria bacterium]|nr:MAG: hypothetical protein DWQ32_00610 [Acidobacteriota bacterium]REK02962.1 MAG: hypothetical protein DWQ38_11525 [Acidobacteriota bacterium]REK13234.1 MAG: hypothetical protein DWQ43_06300 [Acidobacteriota bacterium]REK41228.1 MAG: hypothetical protein DWQ47_13210 [Acidobacteriota bacterium]